jgi:hypothetical protein
VVSLDSLKLIVHAVVRAAALVLDYCYLVLPVPSLI